MSTSTKIPFVTVFGVPVSFEIESEPEREPLLKTVPVVPSAQVSALLAEKLVAACEPLHFCLSTVFACALYAKPVVVSVVTRRRAVFICMGDPFECGEDSVTRMRVALDRIDCAQANASPGK